MDCRVNPRIKSGDGITQASLRRLRRRHREHRIERGGIARFAQARDRCGLAQKPRDARQRLQMIGACPFGREQQEDQVHRLAVERLKVDRAVEPGEQADQLLELRQLAVGNRDAVADPRAPELLALDQRLEDQPLVLPGELRGTGC